jgi:5,10-methylenetetrahydromethanopterin reductase
LNALYSTLSQKDRRIGLGLTGTLSIQDSCRYAILAENAGFESIWVAEHYGAGRDPFVTIAAIASATKAIKLATGVVSAYTRHPAVMGFTLGTLDELSRGRIIFGLGTGNLTRLRERLRLEGTKPFTHVREVTEITRQLLSGRKVTYRGEVYQVSKLNLGLNPYRPRMAVYLGAIQEHMLRLTVQIADGVLFSVASSPGYASYAIRTMREEADRVGRSFDQIDIASYVLCYVSDDLEKAREKVKPRLLTFLVRPKRGESILEMAGLNPELITPIRAAFERGKRREALRRITDKITDELCIIGNASECTKGLTRFRRSGVKLPIIVPLEENYDEAIRALAPKTQRLSPATT